MAAPQAGGALTPESIRQLSRNLFCSPGEREWEKSSHLHGSGHDSGGKKHHSGTHPGAGKGTKGTKGGPMQTHDLPGPKKGGTPGKEA